MLPRLLLVLLLSCLPLGHAGAQEPKAMVAAANPLAVEAGVEMLQAGGSAIDAAIAVQMVLTLVEPQSSGIGGGAFLMPYDRGTVRAYDGRQTAPRAASESLVFNSGEEPLEFMDAGAGGLIARVPGPV